MPTYVDHLDGVGEGPSLVASSADFFGVGYRAAVATRCYWRVVEVYPVFARSFSINLRVKLRRLDIRTVLCIV